MLTKKEQQALASAVAFWARCLPPMGKDPHHEKGIRDAHEAIRNARAALKRMRSNGVVNAVEDTKRLVFLMLNMSGAEQRRLGIMTRFPSGCTRESIDLARTSFEQEPLPRAVRVVVTVDGDDDSAVAQALRNSAAMIEKTGGANGSGIGPYFDFTVDRTDGQKAMGQCDADMSGERPAPTKEDELRQQAAKVCNYLGSAYDGEPRRVIEALVARAYGAPPSDGGKHGGFGQLV